MVAFDSKWRSYLVIPHHEGMRLDRWVRRCVSAHLTQGVIQKLLRSQDIQVDQRASQANYRLKQGETIDILASVVRAAQTPDPPPSFKTKPPTHPLFSKALEGIQHNIIYQDNNMMVLNKPPGLATQGGTKVAYHVESLLTHLMQKQEKRIYLVHRLDKETSGLLMVALNEKTASFLSKALREKAIKKTYVALVAGAPFEDRGTISLWLDKKITFSGEKIVPSLEKKGLEATTFYQTMHQDFEKKWSMLKLVPYTGRKHQLRVHCSAYGFPILGDGKYGGSKAFLPHTSPCPLALHATTLRFVDENGKKKFFGAPFPPGFQQLCKRLGFSPHKLTTIARQC